jgi:16S rRNA (guanine(966)-N(2))-methyltransferase RsmD
MRIIAGKNKGRNLLSHSDKRIRPTSDKVKGAIFSMLGSSLDNAISVDLFAGTGNLGLEALSRGASVCYFSDVSKDSLGLLSRNLDHLSVTQEEAFVFRGDFRKTLPIIGKKIRETSGGRGADLLFADPPYDANFENEIMQLIVNYDIMGIGGLVVLEHGFGLGQICVPSVLECVKQRRYGRTAIDIFLRV